MRNFLFSEFDEISAKQWKQKIQFELKGADYNDTLLTKTAENINIKPFYTASDVPDSRTYENPPWKICEKIYVQQETAANKKAQHVLKNGAESLHFVLPTEQVDLKLLFKNIALDGLSIHIEPAFLSFEFTKKTLNFLTDKNAVVHFHLDIIGHLAKTGNCYINLKKDMETFKSIQKFVQTKPFIKTSVTVDASLYQNAGADIVQQLAYTLAHANEYLNILEDTPVNFCIQASIGGHYFFETAKLRSLRLLWDTLTQAYGKDQKPYLHCTPTKRNKTLYDYNVNLLRTTTEYMSAIVGGADTISSLAYDAIYHKDNEFASRIARNQLLILKHESYFDKVKNPADGSYYIESITQEMSEKALELFKQIETGGGFLEQLKKHVIQKKIKESAAEEQNEFQKGEKVLVGTNKYQNPDNKMNHELELYPFVKTKARKTLIEPIIEKRLAEELEKERLKTEGK